MEFWQIKQYELKLGSKSPAVFVLKQLLQEMMELVRWIPELARIPLNEIFDELTHRAVVKFQNYHNLPRKDGVVDELTWLLIGERLHPARLKTATVNDTMLFKILTGHTKNNARLAPKGYASESMLSEEGCDQRFAEIFGEKNAVAYAMLNKDLKADYGRGASGHSAVPRNDLPLYYKSIVGGKRYRNSDRGGIIHIYTDKNGSARKDVGLFAPKGWSQVPINYYANGNSGLRFSYPTGLTISFVHVGTDNKNKIPSIPSKDSTDTNKFGAIRIGWIAGYGGQGNEYNHTHIIFYSDFDKDERADPREVFCGW